jgi:hypothetical protein
MQETAHQTVQTSCKGIHGHLMSSIQFTSSPVLFLLSQVPWPAKTIREVLWASRAGAWNKLSSFLTSKMQWLMKFGKLQVVLGCLHAFYHLLYLLKKNPYIPHRSLVLPDTDFQYFYYILELSNLPEQQSPLRKEALSSCVVLNLHT